MPSQLDWKLTSETVSGQGPVASETFCPICRSPGMPNPYPVSDAPVEPLLGATTISAVVAVVAVEHDAKGERDFQQAGRGVVDLAP